MLTEEQHDLVDFINQEIDKWDDERRYVRVLEIALAALTQPAIPALKLPDEMYADHPRMRWVGIDELWGRIQGWNDCLEEVKRLNAPHTAPIEPICATGRTMLRSEFNELVGKLAMRNYGTSVDIADVLCAFNIRPNQLE